jgi:hypothetical protein
MSNTDERAARMVALSEQLRRIGDTPREALSGEHVAAQSSMASIGYELAGVVLGIDEDDDPVLA